MVKAFTTLMMEKFCLKKCILKAISMEHLSIMMLQMEMLFQHVNFKMVRENKEDKFFTTLTVRLINIILIRLINKFDFQFK